MIPFFSTSAPHYHTDICPNDRYNACTRTHTCSNMSAHTYTACNITIIPRSYGTLYPLQTTLHNKWTSSHCWPFCLLRAFHFSSQFGVAWWMQMGTYLIGSVPKMEINGALPFLPPPSLSYFELCSVQWCVERTLMRRGEETTPLLDSFKNSGAPVWPALPHTMREESCMGPMCNGVSMPI